jgi:hypothetical protein
MGDKVVCRAMNATATTALRDGITRVLPAPRRLRSGLPAVALAAPAAAWIFAVAALTLLGLGAYHPFMTPADLSLSEAAATRDHLEMLRQIRGGASLDTPARVRSGLVRPGEYVLTPLEAAVASGQVDTVQFLQHHGARMDATTVAGLICLADIQEDREMSAYLKGQAPPALAVDCDSVRLPWSD